MDKTSIFEKDFWVTRHPVCGCSDFLKNYGLWIFTWHREYSSPPYEPGVRRYYDFYSLSHMYDGRGWFASENCPLKLMFPGDAVLVGPEFRHGYGGYEECYVEDSVSFFGPVADQMAKAGMIPNHIFHLGKTRRLLTIIDLLHDPSLDAQYRANMMLQQLILDIFLNGKGGVRQKRENSMEQVLREIQANPARWWQVGELAEICGLCESQFRRVFAAYTGMRPKEYLLQSKMKFAAGKFLSSNLSVKEIAGQTGFRDPFHFSRVFKAVLGFTPTDYAAHFAPEIRRRYPAYARVPNKRFFSMKAKIEKYKKDQAAEKADR